MKLTQKLLSNLHRVFKKEPQSFLALRLRYNGTSMSWEVSEGVLTTNVVGGIGSGLSVNLANYSLFGLVNHLAAQPGYAVEYSDQSELRDLSARVLIDATGDQDASNGDHLLGYTSLLWAYMEPMAVELKEIDHQIDEAIKQMNLRNSEGMWCDEWGSYYGVIRRTGEEDAQYVTRIILEVLRPRGNNVAIEVVARELLGQPVTVNDVRLWGPSSPNHDGLHDHDGTILRNATAVPIYGLFDVDYVYNLESGLDVSEYALRLAEIIETLRDAGTHLRAMNLVSSNLSDTATMVLDDSAGIEITTGVPHDGTVVRNGIARYSGISTVSVSLS